MIPSPYAKYQQTSVQTASPGQLIIMLYDGAIRFLKQGIAGIEERDITKANNALIRAQNIINELTASLNMDIPISRNLLEIYDYMVRRLIEANMKKDVKPAQEVLSHLQELRSAWVQIIKPGSDKTADAE